jgi:hypothetical protein
MNKAYITIVVLLFSNFIAGCNSTRSVAIIKRQSLFKDNAGRLEPTLFTSHTDATQRISIIMADANGKFITFSENPPDAAIQSALGVAAKADVVGKVTAEAQLDFAKTIAELGKRSEAINFHRDGMFRLSEMFNNKALDGSQLAILIDSLQNKSMRIAFFAAQSEIERARLDKFKTLNELFAKADSTGARPTSVEIIELLKQI